MANRILQSSNVTFMDVTDDTKLDIYISSNHPNVQILNPRTGAYTPDWTRDKLELNASIYIGTTQLSSGTTIEWYKDTISKDSKVGTGSTLTVDTNVLEEQSSASYICRATYMGMEASKDIIFSQVDGTTGPMGQPGTDAITFQVYSSHGYALSVNTPTITLQTFAYIGNVAIQAGATYQWYLYNNTSWTEISGATNSYFTVSRDSVNFSNSYMCTMRFNNAEYVGVVTVDDKSDSNKVFTTKPSNYIVGDLWVVGTDYIPAGVEIGTLLKAKYTNATYADNDWTTATKYDEKIDDLQNNIDTYNQYFSFDSTNGVVISARDANGVPSQFSTSLTNERLSFNYGNQSIAYINGTKMNIKEAEIESPLTVTGKYSGSTMLQAPVINIGNFSLIVESNGSLSIIANT